MTARRWLVVALIGLTACGGAATSDLSPPRETPDASGVPVNAGVWGPVRAPSSLVPATRAYYDGAGPAPEDIADGRPACLLLAPTDLSGTALAPVPTFRFNALGEFLLTWTLATSSATGLQLTVLPAGDPADRHFVAPTAQVSTLPDGSALRRTPVAPRAVLVSIPSENCEYEVSPAPALPSTDDATILASLHLVFAP
jgi:hypothetical protein